MVYIEQFCVAMLYASSSVDLEIDLIIIVIKLV